MTNKQSNILFRAAFLAIVLQEAPEDIRDRITHGQRILLRRKLSGQTPPLRLPLPGSQSDTAATKSELVEVIIDAFKKVFVPFFRFCEDHPDKSLDELYRKVGVLVGTPDPSYCQNWAMEFLQRQAEANISQYKK